MGKGNCTILTNNRNNVVWERQQQINQQPVNVTGPNQPQLNVCGNGNGNVIVTNNQMRVTQRVL